MGFANIKEYIEADDKGQTWTTSFRKTFGTAATVTNAYYDYSYIGGSPPANFYASSPLEAAEIETVRGIYVPSVSPAAQYLKSLTLMIPSASANTFSNELQTVSLLDYLMYYPFIDTDAVGEEQSMINNITLPRYDGGYVMAIGQSASSTIGQFTFSYTNQDGVSGRTSPNAFTQILGGGGGIVSADASGTGFTPFLKLQAGDTFVKSIESVTFTVGGGGLMALVIVKPLLTQPLNQACRQSTGTINSFGSPSQVECVVSGTPPILIKDGAVLNLITKGNGGSLASSGLCGILETFWN